MYLRVTSCSDIHRAVYSSNLNVPVLPYIGFRMTMMKIEGKNKKEKTGKKDNRGNRISRIKFVKIELKYLYNPRGS